MRYPLVHGIYNYQLLSYFTTVNVIGRNHSILISTSLFNSTEYFYGSLRRTVTSRSTVNYICTPLWHVDPICKRLTSIALDYVIKLLIVYSI